MPTLTYSILSTEQSVVNVRGARSKITGNVCKFGNPIPSRNDWFTFRANDFIFQGNDVSGKAGLGNMILVGTGSAMATGWKILDNQLHDQTGGTGNGAEMIRFGSSELRGKDFNGEVAGNSIYNHNTSDTELITVKASSIDIHHNTFKNCKASTTFRHARTCKFRDNVVEDCGFRIYGKGHQVLGNKFKRNPNNQLRQIVVGNGVWAEEEQNTDATYTQVRDLLFSNNVIEMADCYRKHNLMWGNGSGAFKPSNNIVKENRITATKGTLALTHDGASWNGNTISNNILWATGTAKYGDMPLSGYTKKDPSTTTPEPIPIPPKPPAMTTEEILADHERRISALENPNV